MKKFHIALLVKNIAESVVDYSQRLQAEPVSVIPNEYALWRTDTLNFSIRQTDDEVCQIRHIGWEVEAAESFTKTTDINGIEWEAFTALQQAEEIAALWPASEYQPA